PSTTQNTTGQGNPGESSPEGNMGEGTGSAVATDDGDQGTIGLASLAPAGVNDTPAGTAAATGTAAYESTTDHEAPGTPEHPATGGNGYADLGNVPVPKADVLVTVPVLALFDITDEPATLDGYGPIPASMARELVANGASSFYRVLVDPRNGAPLEIGRTSYRLTRAMKKALQLRDGKCTFPGCNNPSLDNEADHVQAWKDGGNTGISNLAQLCPKHHRLKHNTGWTPTPATKAEPPGWTSPTGRHYKAEQPDHEPPHWPPGLLTRAPDTAEQLTHATDTTGSLPAQDPPATERPRFPARAPERPGLLPSGLTDTTGLMRQSKDAPGTETPGLLTRATDTTGFLTPAQDPPATQSTGSMDFPDFNPPFAEPIDDNLEDPHDFSPDDPIWDDFYAHPPILPKDPLKEWQRKREWDMVNS
ncbi:HNH endonuclease signature motif containing protein, partial [Pseudarthrobacter siccitolerans]|uniref:HNH endonuclease signature motif containing protein n=1 Tax=Pseudarthrobacter siccitolerans TaxID=861266 RepID=UPI001F38D5C5